MEKILHQLGDEEEPSCADIWFFRGVKVKKRLRLMFKFPVMLEMTDDGSDGLMTSSDYCVVFTDQQLHPLK